jgi:hypothetical protein
MNVFQHHEISNKWFLLFRKQQKKKNYSKTLKKNKLTKTKVKKYKYYLQK